MQRPRSEEDFTAEDAEKARRLDVSAFLRDFRG